MAFAAGKAVLGWGWGFGFLRGSGVQGGGRRVENPWRGTARRAEGRSPSQAAEGRRARPRRGRAALRAGWCGFSEFVGGQDRGGAPAGRVPAARGRLGWGLCLRLLALLPEEVAEKREGRDPGSDAEGDPEGGGAGLRDAGAQQGGGQQTG